MKLNKQVRRTTVGALIGALSGVLLMAIPGSAAPTQSGTAGITMEANGWIAYNNTTATTMALTDEQNFSVSGTVNAVGNCVLAFTEPSIPSGSSAVVSETSYNPTLCEATYAMGLTTPAEAISLGASPSSSASTETVTPLNEYNNKVYYKTEYIDPFFITITSLAVNLSYNYSSSGVLGTWSAGGDGYHFKYDGWSGAAATFSGGINGGTTVFGSGYYKQTNTEFATIINGIAGFPICGLTGNTAVFTENQTVADAAGLNGAAPPAPSGGNLDTVGGACSSLVHFGSEIGQGTIS